MKPIKIFLLFFGLLALLGWPGWWQVARSFSTRQLWVTEKARMTTIARYSSSDKQELTIEVQTPRTYGYRTGTPIPVRIKFVEHAPNIHISVEPLLQGVLSRRQTLWKLVGKPGGTETHKKGEDRYTVDMVVKFIEPDPEPFSAEFLYATTVLANGQPHWHYGKTPPAKFGWSSTVFDGATDYDWGPTGDLPFCPNLKGLGICASGCMLFVLGCWLAIRFWWPKPAPIAVLPTEVVKFWQEIDFAEQVRESGGYFNTVAMAFRCYLGHPTSTTSEIEELLARDDPQREAKLSVLKTLDRALYIRKGISLKERDAVLETIAAIVPRITCPSELGPGLDRKYKCLLGAVMALPRRLVVLLRKSAKAMTISNAKKLAIISGIGLRKNSFCLRKVVLWLRWKNHKQSKKIKSGKL
jgi:hypothetical protein